ncbi:Ppx/GppA phosphatase [Xanthobacter versatilis]|uniref:Ppx/GppA phosphatase n=1 Tax=Xanthobacter autotrophicus (strain ATCC BAA-1158 / Py2) TaxID=78245 RepID=A7IDJ4_XANP2|nr:Ppx/GppA phosphatase [Xanthobacter autotrophicus Py2]
MRDETHGPGAGPGQSCRERAVTEAVTDARCGAKGLAGSATVTVDGVAPLDPPSCSDKIASPGKIVSPDPAQPCASPPRTPPDHPVSAPPASASGHPAPSYPSGNASAVYAAIDLGTNNCRLLVARPTARSFRVVDAFSRIVRLGEGLTASGRLCDEAMARAVAALEVCAAKMDLRGVTRARIVATEACRAADNGAEFCARVEERTGLQLEVVDRRTEAGLAATGCAPLVDPTCDGAVLFDIGGGSTEVVWLGRRSAGDDGPPRARIRSWVSLPVGVVSLSERHGGVRVSPDVFHAMVDEVCGMLDGVRQSWGVRAPGRLHLLGTSGTVTTVAGIHLGLDRYDRTRVDGAWLGASHIEEVVERLMCMSFEERVANPCIGAQRADLVLAGCAIMEAVRRVFPTDRLRVADRGLREGMLVQLMRADGAWRRNRPAGTPSGDAHA